MIKTLSIVIPTYNMEKYLDRCLSSLIVNEDHLSQLEIIVVNDGSKDKSSEIAHRYAENHPDTFFVVDKENGNYGSCINKGIELATGKYFRILDADDWYDTSALSAFLDIADNAASDLILTRRNIHSEESDIISYVPDCLLPSCHLTIEEYSGLKEKPYLFMHCMAFRTEILRESGLVLQTGISYTDSEFCYYPLKCVKNIEFHNLTVYHYNMDRPGQTMSPERLVKSLEDLRKVISRMLVSHREEVDKDRAQYILQTQYLKQILNVFYSTALTMGTRSRENDSIIKNLDEEVIHDKELVAYTDSLSFNRVRYVRLWRRNGHYNTDGIFHAYNTLYKKVKKLLKNNG